MITQRKKKNNNRITRISEISNKHAADCSFKKKTHFWGLDPPFPSLRKVTYNFSCSVSTLSTFFRHLIIVREHLYTILKREEYCIKVLSKPFSLISCTKGKIYHRGKKKQKPFCTARSDCIFPAPIEILQFYYSKYARKISEILCTFYPISIFASRLIKRTKKKKKKSKRLTFLSVELSKIPTSQHRLILYFTRTTEIVPHRQRARVYRENFRPVRLELHGAERTCFALQRNYEGKKNAFPLGCHFSKPRRYWIRDAPFGFIRTRLSSKTPARWRRPELRLIRRPFHLRSSNLVPVWGDEMVQLTCDCNDTKMINGTFVRDGWFPECRTLTLVYGNNSTILRPFERLITAVGVIFAGLWTIPNR